MTVEFLPGDEPEFVDAGPRASRNRSAWLVVALVAVAAAVWGLTRPAAQHPAARPLTARECHAAPDCAAHIGVPVAVGRLLRTHLPLGTRLRVRTVVAVDPATHHRLLIARDITASLDSTTVRIRVQRGGPATQAIVPDPLGVGSLLLHTTTAGYVVRLQYLAPDTVPPRLDELRVLLRDPRLVRS